MTTDASASSDKLDSILERLVRLENLLLRTQLEELEVGEREELAESPAMLSALAGGVSSLGVDTPEEAVSRFAAAFSQAPEDQLETFIDSLNLEFFKGSEFRPYWSRMRSGVKNCVPPLELWPNIVPTLAVMDRLRSDLGAPIFLTSTYRSNRYNEAIGGARNSYHVAFRAIDFVAQTSSPARWADRLKSYRGETFVNPHTGQSFEFRGGVGTYSTFVHIDTRARDVTWP